ncbi:hypothetical protein [Pseudobutyrivibrio xylanivorans]|uniref:Uncharacterized protein n=1 Tax=Pseudobutyrivibrio xylanivorans TaxID=185007 RepID=A0A1G5RQL4_PSEXY|nr:hypothetical protein [Pseudobutyrivibrio xylanivorans]SCZ76383.1 hypothetical protein SAMN02910350_00225 [Pseudobutyrivibrio xylanivorans]
MSELSKRSAKYYFVQGMKMMGLMVVLQAILCVEWFLMADDRNNLFDHIIRMVLMGGVMFMILFNLIYAVYGPNWLDSLVLSMGARRKDIFVGEIIKQFTYIILNTVVYLVIAVTTGNNIWVPIIILAAVGAALAGAIGQVIGFKIKKYGKAYLFVIAIIAGCFGVFASLTAVLEIDLLGLLRNRVGWIIVIAVVLFGLFEFWSYKLGQKSMVM